MTGRLLSLRSKLDTNLVSSVQTCLVSHPNPIATGLHGSVEPEAIRSW